MGFLDRALAVRITAGLVVLAGAYGAYRAWTRMDAVGSEPMDGIAMWLWGIGMAILFLGGVWALREVLPGIEDEDVYGDAPPLPDPTAPGDDVERAGLDPVLWGVRPEEDVVRTIDHRLGRHGHATVVVDPVAPVPLDFDTFVSEMDGLARALSWETELADRNEPPTRVFRRLKKRDP